MAKTRHDDSASGVEAARRFAPTHWSVVLAARGDGNAAHEALETLCCTYWQPIYAFVRREGHGPHDAEDFTQEFFRRLLEKNSLQSVDRSKGRFRSYLLAALKHFLANEWDRAQAQKRGGGVQIISFDEATAEERYRLEPVEQVTPETIFERRWAQTVMGLVIDRLAAETEEQRFEVLKRFLLEDKGAVSYEEAASRLGMSVAAITSAISRMRARFRALLFEEIANTVESPNAVEQEIRQLLVALSD